MKNQRSFLFLAIFTGILAPELAGNACLAQDWHRKVGGSSEVTKSSSLFLAAQPLLQKDVPDNSNSDAMRVFGELEELFKEYFPKAEIKRTGESFKVEYKTHAYADQSGSGRTILGPTLDGVICEIQMKSGRYQGAKVMPLRTNEPLYVSLLMAPYSNSENSYLDTRLLFPPNVSEEFVNRFKGTLSIFANNKAKIESKVVGGEQAAGGAAGLSGAESNTKEEAVGDTRQAGGAGGVAGEGAASDTAAKERKAADEIRAVFEKLTELFKEHYPRAEVKATANSFKVEYKVHRYADESGSGRTVLAPTVDGVICEVNLKPGKYQGGKVMPLKVNESLYVSLQMAPYSQTADKYLETKLLFPHSATEVFTSRFKEIVSAYDDGSTGLAAIAAGKKAAGAGASNVAETVAEKVEAPVAKKDDTDFGGPKFTDYVFSEGRFKIKLPGGPQTMYTNLHGLRVVEYVYPESQGLYNIGYIVMPQMLPYDKQKVFLDILCNSMSQSYKTKPKSYASLSWQGYPGRQLETDKIVKTNDKRLDISDLSGVTRVVLVRRYVYILQAIGSKAWLSSPGVKTFMNSLEVRPELTSLEKSAMVKAQRDAEENRRTYERAAQKQTRSQYDKDRERREAEYKYNRPRYYH
jgi:hypothetical protein